MRTSGLMNWMVGFGMVVAACGKSERGAGGTSGPDPADYVSVPRYKIQVAAGKGGTVKDDGKSLVEITTNRPDCALGIMDPTDPNDLGREFYDFEKFAAFTAKNHESHTNVKTFESKKIGDGWLIQDQWTSREKTTFSSYRLVSIDGHAYFCRGSATTKEGMDCIDQVCSSIKKL